jgi:hypothetical protein
MTDHVWVSSMLGDSRLIVMMLADIADGPDADRPSARDAKNKLPLGEPLEQHMCPRAVWGERRRFKIRANVPHLFNARGYWVVSSKAADILRSFDLGQGALYPVTAYREDQATRLPGDYYCWVFGNRKSALDIEQSRNLEIPSGPPGYIPPTRLLPWTLQDWDVAVSANANIGPDVWIDTHLHSAVFLSGHLGDALAKAGLDRAFRIAKARIV